MKAGRYILTIKKNNYVEEEDILFISKIDKTDNTKHFVLKKNIGILLQNMIFLIHGYLS